MVNYLHKPNESNIRKQLLDKELYDCVSLYDDSQSSLVKVEFLRCDYCGKNISNVIRFSNDSQHGEFLCFDCTVLIFGGN